MTRRQSKFPFRASKKPALSKADAYEARKVATAKLILSDPERYHAPAGSLLRICSEMVLRNHDAEQAAAAEVSR